MQWMPQDKKVDPEAYMVKRIVFEVPEWRVAESKSTDS
jgi:hypothetical protein